MNMSNKVVPAVLALTLASTPLVADTEFGDDVPREVVEQLIGNVFENAPKLYSDLFAAFPPFTLPATFEVVASVDLGRSQRAILRTTLDDAAANAATVAALVAEGWVEMPVPGRRANTGFIGATPSAQIVSLCNDAHGRMSVSVADGGGATYVNQAHTTLAAFAGQQRSCAEEAEMIARGPGMRFGGISLVEYIPVLVMPQPDVPGADQRDFAGGGGGSSNDYETRSYLAITWSGEALMEHFATQVEDQGWEPEGQTTNTSIAFGSWTRTIDGNQYRGLLTLVETADDSWDLKFRIVRMGGAPAGAAPVRAAVEVSR